MVPRITEPFLQGNDRSPMSAPIGLKRAGVPCLLLVLTAGLLASGGGQANPQDHPRPGVSIRRLESDASIRELIVDFELDDVVNDRFIDGDDGPRMLAELIRATDGAHIWVRPYEDLRDHRRIGSEITGAVMSEVSLMP
jgi:hypothetical protein